MTYTILAITIAAPVAILLALRKPAVRVLFAAVPGSATRAARGRRAAASACLAGAAASRVFVVPEFRSEPSTAR